MKKYKKLLSVVLVVLLYSSTSQIANAMEEKDTREQMVSFSNLAQMDVNEKLEENIIDSNGNPAVVGIEKVAESRSSNSTGSTWRVWFNGVTINAEFYMTVSGNKVTSVYDDTISVIGGTYEDDELVMTSTYGKLSFKATSLAGIVSAKCWLKGTVTGSDDKIDVTWQM